jgi:CheY-like chemotaxis protein
LVTIDVQDPVGNQTLQSSRRAHAIQRLRWTIRPKPHILIVDDDREIRGLLSLFLTRHGLRVDTVGDGRTMLRRPESGRFDPIVVDLMLPGEDGFALWRRLRAASSLPITMLTAVRRGQLSRH